MLIKTLTVGQLETNCYVVSDENTLMCAIIDPGAESGVILDYVESNRLKVGAIFLTHGHFDHHMALSAVAEATGAPVYIHKSDTYRGGEREDHKLRDTEELRGYAEGDELSVGGLVFRVMETPGHSAGSVTLRCSNALFTGDTLFRDSCGRTDLGGDMETLLESLRRLSSLDGDYEVYPGHAETSTLDRERSFNYYVRYANGEYPAK
ncbi:MAG: MBL fold metallo-hydrolase [Oscillospiraceae bacterium]|jgi:glyoxylase-like metal-dependent hydrolase (beta-lactamase superfamily II)|nr:MBL fold metallo-hydrolase [Oscillospiraceae bacterium]